MKVNGLLFVISVFLFACSSETDVTEKEIEPVKRTKTTFYCLDDDMFKFIGNDAVPDFKFNAKYLAQNKIKRIVCFERAIAKAKPTDTVSFSPRMVWYFDSLGVNKRLQYYENQKQPVHTEYYLFENEIPILSQLNIDVEHAAVTIKKLAAGKLVAEIRTEPQTADTTFYFYKNNQTDSVYVSSLTTGKFYIKFSTYQNGVLKQRSVSDEANKTPIKKWNYFYDKNGNIIKIVETNVDGGVYDLAWDDKERITLIKYTVQNALMFFKTYSYTENGFLNKVIVELPEGRRELSFSIN